MDYQINEKLIIIRLHPNENLIETLQKICQKSNIKTGIILSGIGQLKNITLGYFKEKGDYLSEDFNDVYELLSLNGTIINQNNNVLTHLHVVISDKDKNTKGGHLINATVEVTNEIVIYVSEANLSRKKSDKTGLNELIIK
jgi:predicted DNA-binding protein with PD1-like motif